MLSPSQLSATVDRIAEVQAGDGMVPWYQGGHGDPWNHVEAAMALTLGGRRREAERAYAWLARTQRPDGSWANYYVDGAVIDHRRDTNVCAYVATGTWHHYLATGDHTFLECMFPVVDAAVCFALRLQQPGGEVLWCLEPDGAPGAYALLSASSSIYLSLRCAIASAEALGRPRPEWELSAGRLASALSTRPSAFEPKARFAMDWYYPVLCGAVPAERAQTRLARGWPTFVVDGRGVRCVFDRPWVTAAETAECALALTACGLTQEARLLLDWAQHLRAADGSYWTGCLYPDSVHFPSGEVTTYSSAAMVLAHHALLDSRSVARLFKGDDLPRGLVLDEALSASEAGADPAQHP